MKCTFNFEISLLRAVFATSATPLSKPELTTRMGWATSEQCLEIYADDTPERYAAERNHLLLHMTKHIGLAGACALTFGAEHSFFDSTFLNTGVSVAALGLGSYNAAHAIKCALYAREAQSFIKRAGQTRETYWVHPNTVRRQVYSMLRPLALPLAAYHDLDDIPIGQLGMVNAVHYTHCETTTSADNFVASLNAATRAGLQNLEATVKMAEAIQELPTPPALVIAQRTPTSFQAAYLAPAISIDTFYRHKRKPQPKERTDLAWMPEPAHAPSR